MTSFTEATRIIDEFVKTYYPILDGQDAPVLTQDSSQQPATGTSPRKRSRVPLLSSLGRKSCSTVHAPIQMPLFDNSAMDGYALRSWQTASASPDNPLTFRVLGMIAAGDEPPIVNDDGAELTCWGIMTGAAFPLTMDEMGQEVAVTSNSRFDACIKLELVTAQYDSSAPTSSASRIPTHITITTPVPREANRRLAGEDIRIGDVLLRPDEVIRKEHVMVLASMGVQDVEVQETWEPTIPRPEGRRRLRIGIINTGKEVVLNKEQATLAVKPVHNANDRLSGPTSPSDASATVPPAPLSPRLGTSQIWNSNGPYIHASLLTWGFHPHDIEVLTVPLAPGQDGDDPLAFQRVIRQALYDRQRPFDVLISTGGVSTGVHDYVPSSIMALGGEMGFHKIKMRPGGPMMFAHLANGSEASKGGRTAYFGLPGNPVAAAVCLRFVVAPALIEMRGGKGRDDGRGIRARIRAPDAAKNERRLVQKKPAETRMYVPARLYIPGSGEDADAVPEVEALARGSNMTKALMHSDGWVRFVEGDERHEVYHEDLVEVFGLDV